MMNLKETLAAFVRERDAALIALDLQWARRTILLISPADGNVSDLTLLCAMHRARYNIVTIPDALRHESAAWLRERGLTDICGMPLLPPGQLPAALPAATL